MKKILLLLIFISIPMYAQNDTVPDFYLGLYGGFNYNTHTASFPELPGIPSCCAEYTGGSGTGFNLGGLFEYPVKDNISLLFRVGYHSLNGDMLEDDIIGNKELRETEPPFNTIDITDAETEHNINASIGMLEFRPEIEYRVYKGLLLSAGLNLGYILNGTVDHYEELIRPENYTFPNGTLLNNETYDTDIPDRNDIQFFGNVGIGYKLPIAEHTYLVPEITYNLAFTDLSSVAWKVHPLTFGASIRVPFGAPEREVIRDTVLLRDTTITPVKDRAESEVTLIDRTVKTEKIKDENHIFETTLISELYEKLVPDKSLLDIEIETTGISADGKRRDNPRLVIEEFETDEQFPLLPYVFFPEGSSNLSRTSQNLLNEREVADFTLVDLPWNVMDLYEHMLNIVGARMREDPGSRITVVGCNRDAGIEKNSLKLSRARAEAVKSYLVDIWDIEPGRILTEARNLPENPGNIQYVDGQKENQRAEIHTENFEILKPVDMDMIEVKANPPVVEIDPEIQSTAGIESWNMDIMQNDVFIRTESGKGEPGIQKWHIDEKPVPEMDAPVVVKMAVNDNFGESAADYDTLKIEQLTIRKKRTEMKEDRRIDRYSLILFDYDKAEISDRHKTILEQISKTIQPDSKVIISGFTDRTGADDYNKELAMKRITEVQKILRVPADNLIMEPVGSETLLYNNDLPEGRNYSRTVKIVVETPVEN